MGIHEKAELFMPAVYRISLLALLLLALPSTGFAQGVGVDSFLISPSMTGGMNQHDFTNLRGAVRVNVQNQKDLVHWLPAMVELNHNFEGDNHASFAEVWWKFPDFDTEIQPLALNFAPAYQHPVTGDQKFALIAEQFFQLQDNDHIRWLPKVVKFRDWFSKEGMHRIHGELVWLFPDAPTGWIDTIMYAPAYFPMTGKWGHVGQADIKFQNVGEHVKYLPTRLRMVMGYNDRFQNGLTRFEFHWRL